MVYVCNFGVGATSILCTSCDLLVHNKCPHKTDHLTDNRNCLCRQCSREIVSAAIPYLKEVNFGNNKFHVESTLKYLGDTIGQCGGCSDSVPTCIVSLWKAFRFQELLPVLTNCAIRTKLRGNVDNMCVRKMLLYGSKTWPVLTEDVQHLVTVDSGMIT